MAQQVISLGSEPFDFLRRWQGAILVDSGLINGGVTAYLRETTIATNGNCQLRLADSQTANPLTIGPDFTDAFETAETAVTFAEAGGSSVVLKGPNHSDNTNQDSVDPYAWTPDNATALVTWFDGLGSGEVTLTLDDGATVEDVTLTAQSLEAQATLSSPTLQLGTPVDPVELTAQSLEAEATLSSPTLQVTPPLQLSDFDATGLETEALALIQSASQVDVFSRPPRTARGELLAGELEISDSDEPITRLRITGSGANWVINDNGDLDLTTYFSAGGAGNDLTLHVQTSENSVSFPVAGNIAASGGGFIRFNIPSSSQAFIGGISEGDRFIFALTRPAAVTVDLDAQSLEAEATLSSPALTVEDPDEVTLSAQSLEAEATLSSPTLTVEDPDDVDLDAQSLEAEATLSSPALTVEDPDPVDLDAQSLEAEATLSSPTLRVTVEGEVTLSAQSLEAEATLSSPALSVVDPDPVDLDAQSLEAEATLSSPALTVVVSDAVDLDAQSLEAEATLSQPSLTVADAGEVDLDARSLEAQATLSSPTLRVDDPSVMAPPMIGWVARIAGSGINVWSGEGELTFDSVTYSSGSFINVRGVTSTVDREKDALALEFSVADSTFRAQLIAGLGPSLVTVEILKTTDFGKSWSRIGRKFVGRLSRRSMSGEGQYVAEVVNRERDVDRGDPLMWSHEDQMRRFPGDKGLEFMRELAAGIEGSWPP